MGYKCPICFEDFGKVRDDLDQHLADNHEDAGDEWLKFSTAWKLRQERKKKRGNLKSRQDSD